MRRLILSACLACLAACGATAPIGGPAFCDQWLTEWCMHQINCCTDATARYPSVAACIAEQRPSCTLGTGSAFLSVPPTAIFDSARANDALSALRAADCSFAAPSLDSYNPPLVRGTLVAGQDCSPIGGDLSPALGCGPSYRCLLGVTRTGTLRGQCVIEPTIGASCTSQICAPGLYCNIAATSSAGTCQMQVGPGMACTSDFACAQGECTDTGSGAGARSCPLILVGAGSTWCVPGAARTAPPVDAGTD